MNEKIIRNLKAKSHSLVVSITALRENTVDWTNPLLEFEQGEVSFVRD